MSLAIDISAVAAVLLADGWHNVTNFRLDYYEYVMPYDGDTLLNGGECEGVSSTGFAFITDGGRRIKGPLTSLLAIEETEPSPDA
jgi:hypothetical protein